MWYWRCAQPGGGCWAGPYVLPAMYLCRGGCGVETPQGQKCPECAVRAVQEWKAAKHAAEFAVKPPPTKPPRKQPKEEEMKYHFKARRRVPPESKYGYVTTDNGWLWGNGYHIPTGATISAASITLWLKGWEPQSGRGLYRKPRLEITYENP